ncbi:EcsC family protein [Bacillus alkalicola]|uniref:EcsC family protein n=2 Tax=Bacillaceae TaxID=186817 RepID=A0ABS6JTX2_9BACI|nr:EcsC family protein [Bacillus alkalicola]MBU9721124.1 EcsC family protein [Bacillus alkalicola]
MNYNNENIYRIDTIWEGSLTMSLSHRDMQVWNEIEMWESRHFSEKGTDFSLTYQKWVNSRLKKIQGTTAKNLLTKLDNILFHLQAFVQQGRFDQQAKDNIFSQARIFRSDIYSTEDMQKLTIDQLRFIAKKELAKQRLTALAQGGLTGVGGLAFTLSDLPFMLTINLRTVQLMSMIYGYDLRRPYEMMMVLKVFHAISLPKALQENAWNQLINEIRSNEEEEWLFYEGDEEVTSKAWMQRPLNHIFKLIMLNFLRKKLIQGIPIISIATGAGLNYQFARHIAESSHMFYQKRFLMEKHPSELLMVNK